jgi:hypothetical protein
MQFCPFCREAFEHLARCPDHDVELVPLRELGRFAWSSASDEQPLGLWSLRHGRGFIALGSFATWLGFMCPLGRITGDIERSSSLWTLAHAHALRLWIVPLAAVALLLILYRRRTLAALRAARLAALFVSVLPSAVVLSTWLDAREAARALAIRSAAAIEFHAGLGAWLVWASGLLWVWGSVILGVRAKPKVR